MDRNSRRAGEQGHDALQRVRREGRWWWVQARHTRRIWRWALLAAGVLFLALILLRRPLADWFWDEPQIEQLIEQGDRALAAGQLSSADGRGARDYFQAALALDGDRSEARDGLARTGAAALRSGEAALASGALEEAAEALALARQLQVPQRDSEALARQLRERRAALRARAWTRCWPRRARPWLPDDWMTRPMMPCRCCSAYWNCVRWT